MDERDKDDAWYLISFSKQSSRATTYLSIDRNIFDSRLRQ